MVWRLVCRRGFLPAYGHCGCRTYSDAVRVRFAPSPTGHLHLGGLRSALYNYLFARAHKGKFVLRIEDTDQTRIVPDAVEKLSAMLQWSGIEIDEGPQDGGSYGPYIQSQRLPLYHEHIQTLLQNGRAYRCFCTTKRLELLRKDATRRGENPKYDNKCRHLKPEEVEQKLKTNVPYTIRFKLSSFTEAWEDIVYGPITYDVSQNEGDPILMKSDRFPTYHFANIVDDHLMNITHVLRGVEWQVSTPKHLLLYQAFGWDPPKFGHLPLILNKDGSKLSKRQNDIHVEHMKNSGCCPEAVLNLLTSIGSGFKVRSTVGFTMPELVDNFDLGLMKTNSTRLDMERLPEYNRVHLQQQVKVAEKRLEMIQDVRKMVTDLLGDRLEDSELQTKMLSDAYIGQVLEWATQERIHRLEDLLQPEYHFIWMLPRADVLHDLTSPGGQGVKDTLKVTMEYLESVPDLISVDDLAKALKKFAKGNHFKYGPFMKMLRISLSGLMEGPPVAEMITILGKDAALQRLKSAYHQLDQSQDLV